MSSKRPMDDWFTYREAAQILGISPANLIKRVTRGYVTAVQRGSTWFIHQDEVERLKPQLAAQRAYEAATALALGKVSGE